jgi:acetolactate synthase I/II/III large subunit
MNASQQEQGPQDQTVAELLVDYLARAGVEHIFGVAGSTIMPILDGLEVDGRVRYVAARYELSAAEMASGYARAGARLGVVMTHVGPGATSCVTAMVGAARDGVPLLLITGNEETETLARQPYHDWELLRVMGSITRFSYQITRPDQLPHVVRRALGEAARGVTQPVHIDLPEDIGLQTVPGDVAQEWLAEVGPVLDALSSAPAVPLSRPTPSAAEVEQAARLLAAAQALHEAIGAPLPYYRQDKFDTMLAVLRLSLDEETFSSTWREGKAMSLDEMIAYALDAPLST